MKKAIIISIALVSCLFLGKTAGAQNSDKAAVEKVIKSYFSALNSSDAGKVVSHFTSNGVLLANSAPTATGTDQLKGTFQYVFDNFKYSLEVTIGDIEVSGKYAFVRSVSKGSFTIKSSGQNVQDDFREVFILEKASGTWKISTYMYNKSK